MDWGRHIMWYYGLLLSAAYSATCLPRRAGGHPSVAPTVPEYMHRGSVVVAIDDKEALHVHHWILLAPLILLPLPDWLHWFVGGMVAQGLLYSDRCDCFVPNPYTMLPLEPPQDCVEDWV